MEHDKREFYVFTCCVVFAELLPVEDAIRKAGGFVLKAGGSLDCFVVYAAPQSLEREIEAAIPKLVDNGVQAIDPPYMQRHGGL